MEKKIIRIRRAPGLYIDQFVLCRDDGRPVLTIFDRKRLKDFIKSPANYDFEFIDETKDRKKRADLSGVLGDNDGDKLRNALFIYGMYRDPARFGYIYLDESKTDGTAGEQTLQLRDAGADEMYRDISSGGKKERPKLDQLKQIMKAGDTLFIPTLHSIANTAEDAAKLIGSLNDSGIAVNILDIGIVDGSETGRMIRKTMDAMLSFNEGAAEKIPEKKPEHARKGSPKVGRPRLDPKKIREAMKLLEDGKTYSEVSKETGISRISLYRYWSKEHPVEEYPKEESTEIPGQMRIKDIEMHMEEEK